MRCRFLVIFMLLSVPAWAARPSPSAADQLKQLTEAQKQSQEALRKLLENDQLQTPDSPITRDDLQALSVGEEQKKFFEENAQKLQEFLDLPLTRELIHVISTPSFQTDLKTVVTHPRRHQLLYLELGWMVLMFFFRAWLFGQPAHWTRRIWTRVWTALLFLGVGSYILPVLLFGAPYARVMDSLVNVFLKIFAK